jgi:mono/diheme cytochrome c family protein
VSLSQLPTTNARLPKRLRRHIDLRGFVTSCAVTSKTRRISGVVERSGYEESSREADKRSHKSLFGRWQLELGRFPAKRRARALVLLTALALSGCRQDMHDNPRYEPLERSTFFADGRSQRPLVPNTVPRGFLREDEHLYQGKVNGQLAADFPLPVTAAMMLRGQDQYNVFCSPCHGRTGLGDGMVVRRGYRAPTSFHDPRLRQAPPGYIFDVISNGFGAMPDYASQIPVQDRWAIAAFLKALQFSRSANVNDVPADRRGELDRPAGNPGNTGAGARGAEKH